MVGDADADADADSDADADADADADSDADADADADSDACAAPDGTPLATPGAIDCGDEICAPGVEACCRTGADLDGTVLGTCQAGAGCDAWILDCDDSADCPADQACCNDFDPAVGAFHSRCVAPQPAPAARCGDDILAFQVCACDADCGPGEACQATFTEVGELGACGAP
jgi:hypothetical protein